MIKQAKELFLLLFAVLLSRGQCVCDRGWLENNQDNCYYFSNDTKTWNEANDFCLSCDSNLTSILDSNEGDFLSSKVGRGKPWLGLTYEATEGEWKWTDGNPFNQSKANWGEKQPKLYDAGRSAKCAAMVTSKGGHWYNYNCNKTKSYICKRAHIMSPNATQALNLTEQLALKLVEKLTRSGKVVYKPFVMNASNGPSCFNDGIICASELVMKKSTWYGLAGELVESLHVGSSISIRGRILKDGIWCCNFAVELWVHSNVSNVALRLKANIGENVFERNAHKVGFWGKAEYPWADFQFALGHYFEMTIQLDEGAFDVSVNGVHQPVFQYRIGIETITHVVVRGDVTLIAVMQM